MSSAKEAVEIAVKSIRTHTDAVPKLAIVLGSGLGSVADSLGQDTVISYGDIPGFPVPSVSGHAGQLSFGTSTVCLQGRVHLYEGDSTAPLKVMVRSLKAIGCKALLLTNAAGSLRSNVGPGELVALTDHINLQGSNPLVGPNDDDFGPRFVGMDNAWDADLRKTMRTAARESGVTVHEGVFASWLGPSFETPAEIRMLSAMGADTVGMSMAPENLVARHCGLRVVGVSAITNLAAGLSPIPLSHEQTLEGAKLANNKLARLIGKFVELAGPELD